MIFLRWFEDGELKRLELRHNAEVAREIVRIEKLKQKSGQPTAYLEHPVTDMLAPIHGSLYQVHTWVKLASVSEEKMLIEIARIIDAHDETRRASAYITYLLELTKRKSEITELRTELAILETHLEENRPQEAE